MSSGWLPKHRQLLFQIFEEGPNPFVDESGTAMVLTSDHKYLRIRDLCQELAFVIQCEKSQSCNSYNSFVFTVL